MGLTQDLPTPVVYPKDFTRNRGSVKRILKDYYTYLEEKEKIQARIEGMPTETEDERYMITKEQEKIRETEDVTKSTISQLQKYTGDLKKVMDKHPDLANSEEFESAQRLIDEAEGRIELHGTQ
eukprot:TRINITY_DN65715_c0_g1_i1.p1 TRINITY_DN65715_c0_g1~~TRINITY_DN65715_c0_g1_i1.p1  ORF type:complete len:124 (+),score=15.18 TRINITY_DN65715_c0_g1_i1:97-468(+)